VDEQQPALVVAGGEPFQEGPPAVGRLPGRDGGVELSPRPVDRRLGCRVEVGGLAEDGVLVVAQQGEGAAVHDEVEAVAGVGTVADHVPQAVDGFDGVAVDIVQDGPQGLQVGVDVTEDGQHRQCPGNEGHQVRHEERRARTDGAVSWYVAKGRWSDGNRELLAVLALTPPVWSGFGDGRRGGLPGQGLTAG
jgi:hypothetical protein